MSAFPAALVQQNALLMQFPKVTVNTLLMQIFAQNVVLARVFAQSALLLRNNF